VLDLKCLEFLDLASVLVGADFLVLALWRWSSSMSSISLRESDLGRFFDFVMVVGLLRGQSSWFLGSSTLESAEDFVLEEWLVFFALALLRSP
jgi:hypothetical protein